MNELKNERHYIEGNEQGAIFQTMNISIKPEDSVNITNIVSFYDNVAETIGLDKDAVRYDCTKIDVSRNIQDNIFSVWEKMGASDLEIGMTWCNSGPKTDDKLPHDTINITHGFFRNENDEPIPFVEIAAKARAILAEEMENPKYRQAAKDHINTDGNYYIPVVPPELIKTIQTRGGKWDPDAKCLYFTDPVKAKEAERLVNDARERGGRSATQSFNNEAVHEV